MWWLCYSCASVPRYIEFLNIHFEAFKAILLPGVELNAGVVPLTKELIGKLRMVMVVSVLIHVRSGTNLVKILYLCESSRFSRGVSPWSPGGAGKRWVNKSYDNHQFEDCLHDGNCQSVSVSVRDELVWVLAGLPLNWWPGTDWRWRLRLRYLVTLWWEQEGKFETQFDCTSIM